MLMSLSGRWLVGRRGFVPAKSDPCFLSVVPASLPFFCLLLLARALDPVSERGESVGKPCPFPQNPVRAVGRTTRATRGTSSRTTPEGLGVAVAKEGLDTLREVTTSFSFGFCVNVCVWRQSCKVELLKCSV